jgi:hypothetical protein
MDNIGDLVSACWRLRLAIGKERLRDGYYAVIINQDLAEKIHANLVAVSPGSDEVDVLWFRDTGPGGSTWTERAKVPKPSVPEPGEWFRIFDIPVVVLDC